MGFEFRSLLERNKLKIVVSVLILESLFLIWHFKYLPLADLPRHMLAAKIIAQHDNPETAYNQFFIGRVPWNPYSTYYWFAVSTEPFLGIRNATRLFLSLASVLTVVSFWIWLRTLGVRPRIG